MWITMHLLIWKGPATQIAGKDDDLKEKDFTQNVDMSKIATFFMNPQTVARNMLVCTSFVWIFVVKFVPSLLLMFQFLITSTFWFLPSLLWKKTLFLPSEKEYFLSSPSEEDAEERISGIVSAIANSGMEDIYNRLLCPTCIVQIIFINTMLVCRTIVIFNVILIHSFAVYSTASVLVYHNFPSKCWMRTCSLWRISDT